MRIKDFFRSRLLLRAAAVSIAAIGTLHGGAVHAADATGTASATVVAPIAISKTTDLDFGKFSAGTGGTVVMSTASARSKTGAVVLLTGSAGGAASFNVTGDANATYAITLPTDGTVSVTHTDTTTTMAVASFTSDPATTGTLSAGGSETVGVGATLTVASAQKPGIYSGSFTVTVEYN